MIDPTFNTYSGANVDCRVCGADRPCPRHDPPERNDMKSLAQMGTEVYAWCTRKGWEPDADRSFGDEVALLHSEASEALEAYRIRKFDEYTTPEGKPDDVASEFADILIRLVHYSHTHGIDLEAEYERKMAYNEKRPWRHGGRVL